MWRNAKVTLTMLWVVPAGVGNDPRDRHFNTVSQGEKYDPEAELITSWVPELACLPLGGKHRPWEAGLLDDTAYPVPCVDVTTQINRPRQ